MPPTPAPLRFQREPNNLVPCWGDACHAAVTWAAAVVYRGDLWLIVHACDAHQAVWEGRRIATVTARGTARSLTVQ